MGFHVTSDYSYVRRELAQERLVLAGDAGGFFDPVFSSGVYLATASGKLAGEFVARAHREGLGSRPANGAATPARSRATRPSFRN